MERLLSGAGYGVKIFDLHCQTLDFFNDTGQGLPCHSLGIAFQIPFLEVTITRFTASIVKNWYQCWLFRKFWANLENS